MKVKNRNVGTPMLAHYCPNCGNEVFLNDRTAQFDPDRCCPVGKCPHCDTELEFPNTAALMELLGL